MHVQHSSLLFSGLLLMVAANRCPDSDDLGPSCSCSTGYETKTSCTEIRHVEELRKVFSDTGDHPMVVFELEKSVMSYFPASALKEKSVRQLQFVGTSLVGLFDRVPEQNNKLKDIMLVECNVLRDIEWSLLRNLNNLTSFYAENVNTIRSLDKEFMENMPIGITEIVLFNTGLSKINDRVFERLTRLSVLTLMTGKITTLKRTMFPIENSLTRIAFEGNRLSELPDNIFSDMPKLEYVCLDDNQFTTISERIFKEISERKLIMTFKGNNIKCDCKIRWALGKQWKLTAKCHLPKQFKDKSFDGPNALSDTDLDYCDDA